MTKKVERAERTKVNSSLLIENVEEEPVKESDGDCEGEAEPAPPVEIGDEGRVATVEELKIPSGFETRNCRVMRMFSIAILDQHRRRALASERIKGIESIYGRAHSGNCEI